MLALLLLLAVPATAFAQSPAALRKEERALRTALDDPASSEQADMDLDAGRFELWWDLAKNLEQQGRVDEAIAAMYRGAGEIPTRSADFRATARWAMAEAVKFEERLKGPTLATTRASWGAAISVQRGRSPVDRLEAGLEPFANGYLNDTIRRLTAIGRHDEAHALAMGAMEIATSFRLHAARGDVQAREVKLYRDRSWAMHTVVRTAFTLAAKVDPAIDADLNAAEATLQAGDAAEAERSYRAFLAAQPDPIIVSRFRLRATIGLIRALRAQKKDAEAETLRTELLDRLRWQSWPDGPQIVAVRRATG
jgi:tetratricopeptide (TPR) repeat protein